MAADRLQPVAALAGEDRELIEAALAARERAHAPHSGILVGAAVRDSRGTIHLGCNVETASYGLTMCAERVALFAAVAAGATSFLALAVAGPGQADCALPPCGACRQVIHDLAGDVPLLMATLDGRVERSTTAEMLPAAFDARFLEPENRR